MKDSIRHEVLIADLLTLSKETREFFNGSIFEAAPGEGPRVRMNTIVIEDSNNYDLLSLDPEKVFLR